jgi:hypothetical protein
MNRILLILSGLLISGAAHANDAETRFYQQTVYMIEPASSTQTDCAALPGRPSSLWGNQEAVKETDTYGKSGRMLRVSGVHEDGSRTDYWFFLDRSECMLAAAEIRNEPWYVAQYRGDCVRMEDSFRNMHTPEAVHAVMTRNGSHIELQHRGPDIAILLGASGRVPPLVMVRGLQRCEKIATLISQ